MFDEFVLRMIDHHVSAIAVCLQSGFPLPALVLVYVGIDAFGAFGRPLDTKRSAKSDFVAWADRYMVGLKKLPVTGEELYSARCAVLHDLGSESKLSRRGTVRPIHYAWGNREVAPANAVIAKYGLEPKGVVVKVETIANAFVDGIASFAQEVDATPAFESEVAARSRRMFGLINYFPGTL